MARDIVVLGFAGVDVVGPAYDIKDEPRFLLNAQNAEFFKDKGQSYLRTRAGMVVVAAVGLGAIDGIAGLPLDPPIIGTAANAKHRIYTALQTGWLKSLTAGTTFAATTDLARSQSSPFAYPGVTGWSLYIGIKTSAQLGARFFYVLSDGAANVFAFGYDGTEEAPMVRLAVATMMAQPMFSGNGRVHLVVQQAAGSAVVALDPVTGQAARLFAALTNPEVFTAGVYYQGRLWMTTALHASGARLLAARTADILWTAELFTAPAVPTGGTTGVSVGASEANPYVVVPGVIGQTYTVTSIALQTGGGYKAYAFYIHATGNFADGDTVTIGDQVYTYQTVLTNVAGNVLIGPSWQNSLDYLVAAMDLGAGAGTFYAAATTLNVKATGYVRNRGDWEIVATARVAGLAGNAIACLDSSAAGSWIHEGGAGTSFFKLGADPLVVTADVFVQDTDGLQIGVDFRVTPTQTFGAGFTLPANLGLQVLRAAPTDGFNLVVTGFFSQAAQEVGFSSVAHYAAGGATSQPDYLYLTTYSTTGAARILRRNYAGVYSTVLTSPDLGGL